MAFLAPSLVHCRSQINAIWPHRDHSSDGWIGDAAHQAHQSDHNPDSKGEVHAIDIDKDGIHVPTVLAALLISPPTTYVIHNRRIWIVHYQMRPRKYLGDNPHTSHIHESIAYTRAAETWSDSWFVLPSPTRPPLKQGMSGTSVRLLQAYLLGHWANIALDGDFGPATLAAVRGFQTRQRLTVDGIVGPHTWHALATGNI